MKQFAVMALATLIVVTLTSATTSVDLQGQVKKKYSVIEIASPEKADSIAVPTAYVEGLTDRLVKELSKVKQVKHVIRPGTAPPTDAATLRLKLFFTRYSFTAEPATRGTGSGSLALAGRVSFLEAEATSCCTNKT